MLRRDFVGAGLTSLQTAAMAPPLDLFFRLLSLNGDEAKAASRALTALWRDSYAIMLVELLRIYEAKNATRYADPVSPARAVHARLQDFVGARTGKGFGPDLRAWSRWAWSLPYDPHPNYAEYKGQVYSNVDPRMQQFFPPGVQSTIRLDQVEWGGVPVNGIPPLVNPKTLPAAEASYLKDSHAVFGIALAGEARAYPKRILGWHEMARDRIGGRDIAVVYCTLCGTVIPYFPAAGGRAFTFGTSGMLYESSKLMFDEETKSLWSTLQGKPVIGALARAPLELAFAPVVTTKWGEWRREHPNTTVLSLDTGHSRDYGEGAAYREYFGTDELMFEVSRRDSRLRNKEEVLVVRLAGKKPLAISTRLLQSKRGYNYNHEGVPLTIQTSAAGANRVFANGQPVASHRAFWFGWYSQYPDTVLLK